MDDGRWIMEKGWKIIYRGGEGEIVEKKSRFIARIFSIKNEEEAFALVDAQKKQYWDARHNCYAFIVGERGEVQRYSDDGEPGGTAGKPMLEVLLAEEITNCLVVVTRYFGGVLLGTGGLVRAYQQAVKEGLAASDVVRKEKGNILTVETDYNSMGKIQYAASGEEGKVFVTDCIYTDKVLMKILASKDSVEAFVKKITEATNGKALINKEEERVYVIVEGKPVLL